MVVFLEIIIFIIFFLILLVVVVAILTILFAILFFFINFLFWFYLLFNWSSLSRCQFNLLAIYVLCNWILLRIYLWCLYNFLFFLFWFFFGCSIFFLLLGRCLFTILRRLSSALWLFFLFFWCWTLTRFLFGSSRRSSLLSNLLIVSLISTLGFLILNHFPLVSLLSSVGLLFEASLFLVS